VTIAVRPTVEGVALAPIRATIRAAFGADLPGLAPGLVVPAATAVNGWLPATALVDGSRLPDLLDAAKHRWRAAPHAAAALAWKAYTYWLALPAALGWAAARRVPLLHPDDVLVHIEDHRPLLTLGLRPSVRMAVLPSDPLLLSGVPGLEVVPDEAALLAALRATLLDAHLAPLLERTQEHVRLGSRTLLGSLASGVAHGVLRAADVLPGSSTATVEALLGALGVADLVDLVPGADGRPAVQRRTCCLAFTLPEPKICTGCCIRPQ
jgi:hypothetical protein